MTTAPAPEKPPKTGTLLQTVFGVLMLLLLLGGGGWFYRTQEQDVKGEVEAQLEAIARLKVDQIVAWRVQRLADAATLMERLAFIADASQWLAAGAAETAEAKKAVEQILRRFGSLQKQYQYHDILLVDLEGRVRLSVSGYAGARHAGAAAALTTALEARKPVFTDLHTEQDDPTPHIGVAAPLFSNHGKPPRPLGAVILVSDARKFLFPLIQTWPVPSRTAETLLVRREGDDVLFLNELRHQPDTALKLRIPLSRRDVPAVCALLGHEGVFEGKDYRGVDVLAVIKAIPDSPWFMVAKVDAAEAFAVWRFRSVLILLVLSGAVALMVVGALLGRQRDSKAHYRTLYHLEAARRRSEERHGITLKSIGDAVITTDAGGRVELLNPVAETLTAWTNAEACGRPIDEVFRIINEETRETVENPVARVLLEGLVVGLANHTLLIARDGAERPIADSGAPIRDEQGAISGVVLVFRDQTEERAAIEALRESEGRFRQLFEIVPMPLCFVDEQGNLATFNQHFVQTFGYTHQDVPTLQEWSKLAYPDPEYRRWVSHTWKSAILNAMQNKTDIEPMELRVTCKNGEARTMIVSGSTIGESFLAAFFDITERKGAEETIRQERDFSRAALDSLPGLFYLFDEQGRFLRWNWNFERVAGYTAEEISRLSVQDLFDEKDKEIVAERISQVFLTGESSAEAELRSKDGTKTPYYFTGNLFRFEKEACLIGMGIDVSERKRVEEDREKLQAQLNQAQKMESVGRLAGGVAHDYNNMLGVIIGYTGMALARVNSSDPLHADLEQILKAARRSADLTRQLLAFARRQTIAPRLLDLNETVESMLKMLRRLIGEDIDLAWLPASDLGQVKMDPAQIDQILANLCVNARDAIRGVGKVTIETQNVSIERAYCSLHADSIPGDYVLLVVSDDGCGMDKETVEKIFEPFFTTKEVGEGTGLGLATVYGIVRQNNGFINVYSEPERGATFKIYLPRHAGEAEAMSEESAGEIPQSNGETVLLVEDDAVVMRMGHMMLERLGYRVVTANTPGEAMRLAEELAGGIDLLLTDVVMPEMSGRDLARQLHALHPQLKIMFMSGYTANAIVHRGELQAGVHFIQKPFSMKDLAVQVRAVLAGDPDEAENERTGN